MFEHTYLCIGFVVMCGFDQKKMIQTMFEKDLKMAFE